MYSNFFAFDWNSIKGFSSTPRKVIQNSIKRRQFVLKNLDSVQSALKKNLNKSIYEVWYMIHYCLITHTIGDDRVPLHKPKLTSDSGCSIPNLLWSSVSLFLCRDIRRVCIIEEGVRNVYSSGCATIYKESNWLLMNRIKEMKIDADHGEVIRNRQGCSAYKLRSMGCWLGPEKTELNRSSVERVASHSVCCLQIVVRSLAKRVHRNPETIRFHVGRTS